MTYCGPMLLAITTQLPITLIEARYLSDGITSVVAFRGEEYELTIRPVKDIKLKKKADIPECVTEVVDF